MERERQTLLIILGLLVALTLLAIFSGSASNIKPWVEIVQGLLTIVAILVGGLWAFYIFILERSFAAHVQRQFELKQVIDLVDGKVVVVSVKLKNSGRTRVDKKECQFRIMAVTKDQLNLPVLKAAQRPRDVLSQIDALLDDRRRRSDYEIFKRLAGLEPDEETAEDVLLTLGKSPTLDKVAVFKVEVVFSGFVGPRQFRGDKTKIWASRGILDIRMVEGSSSGNDKALT